MSGPQLHFFNRGNQADYIFGTLDGWGAFDVVRWQAVEEMSQPFQYDITVVRSAANGESDIASLVETGATLRIAAQGRFRPIHGIIAEAEELERTPSLFAYRFLLVPHLWALRHRRACRTFRRKSIVEIVTMVLENRVPGSPTEGRPLQKVTDDVSLPTATPSFDGDFQEPLGVFRFKVDDGPDAVLLDPARRTHVVQYNESDLEFISRLFEEEGLSFFFEHGDDALMMTITDRPGHDPQFDHEKTLTMRAVSQGGSTQNQEVIRSLRSPNRMRSRSAVVVDMFETAPLNGVRGEASKIAPTPFREQHFEFPGVFDADPEDRALDIASRRRERFDAERFISDGTSTVRTLEPGRRYLIQDGDGLRPDRHVFMVRVETEARQLSLSVGEELDLDAVPSSNASPFYRNRFTVLPAALRFRPPPTNPKPRIYGLHQAIVTAEEFGITAQPEINANALGAVRIRFPWDTRPPEQNIPSSRPVSVSHYWAGVSYGALHTPRVGQFVLVAFQDGDPDRPVIVGRLYSEQMPPPYDPSKEPTRTTWKSKSSPNSDGFNELRFEDKAKAEEIFLHAQKDLNEVVLASHSTSVGGDQSNSVGNNRSHSVKGTETVTVTGDRTTGFLSNETRTVSGFLTVSVGASEARAVASQRSTTVGADDVLNVAANLTATSTNTYIFPTGDFQVASTSAGFTQHASFYVKAGGCELSMSAGIVTINNGAGASIALIGAFVMIDGGGGVAVTSGGAMLLSTGATLTLQGGEIDATAGAIKLNG